MDVLLLYLLCVAQVAVSATRWSLVQKRPAGCVCVCVSNCGWSRNLTKRVGLDPIYYVASQKERGRVKYCILKEIICKRLWYCCGDWGSGFGTCGKCNRHYVITKTCRKFQTEKSKGGCNLGDLGSGRRTDDIKIHPEEKGHVGADWLSECSGGLQWTYFLFYKTSNLVAFVLRF